MTSISFLSILLICVFSFTNPINAALPSPPGDDCDPRVIYIDNKYGQIAQDQITSFHAVLEYLLENPESWDQDIFSQLANGSSIGMTLVSIFVSIPANTDLMGMEACSSFGSWRERTHSEHNGLLQSVLGAVFNRRHLIRGGKMVKGIFKRFLLADEESRKLSADGLDVLLEDYYNNLVGLLEMYNESETEELTVEYFGWAYNQVSFMACTSCTLANAMGARLGKTEPNICGEDAAWLNCSA